MDFGYGHQENIPLNTTFSSTSWAPTSSVGTNNIVVDNQLAQIAFILYNLLGRGTCNSLRTVEVEGIHVLQSQLTRATLSI